MKSFFGNQSFLLFIPLALVTFAYLNMLKGPFLFDDEHFIQKNKFIQSADFHQIFTTSVTGGAGIKGNFYRPLQQCCYAILYKLGGVNPFLFHLFSLLVHLGNVLLLYLFFRSLEVQAFTALIAVTLWGIHPVNTEAVSYISGLADLLGMLFLLAGLLAVIRAIKSEKVALWWYLFAFFSFCLACLSKEHLVICFPLSVLTAWYVQPFGTWKRNRPALLFVSATALLSIAYLAFKFTLFNFSSSLGLTETDNIYTGSLWVRLVTFMNIGIEYIRITFFPLHLNYEKPYRAYTSLATAQAISLLVLLIIAGLYIRHNVNNHKYRPAVFSLLWLFICLAPFSGIIPLNAIYLEHWLYFPLAGALLIPAIAWENLKKGALKNVAAVFMVLYLLAFFIRTRLRNEEWSDIERFYLKELKYTKNSVRIFNNLAMKYSDEGDEEKAATYYLKAIEAGDIFAQPHHNLANLYIKQNRVNEALEELHRALLIDPNFIYSLGRTCEIAQALKDVHKQQVCAQINIKIQQGRSVTRNDIELLFGHSQGQEQFGK